MGHVVVYSVEALYYKPEGCGCHSDEVLGFFIPSSCSIALGSTQPLREISTRILPGGKEQPVFKADNLTAICEPAV
jgi:hypothetical protein